MVNNYRITEEESKRITVIRAICLIMVMFLHQYTSNISIDGTMILMERTPIVEAFEYICSRIITFSAVPLFFLISSVLLYSKDFTWRSNIEKKIKTLVIPYFLWISIYIFIYFLGQTLPITSKFFANAGRNVADMKAIDFIGAFTDVVGQGIFVNALWFVRDLIIYNFFSVIIKKVIDKIPFLTFIVILSIWLLMPISTIMSLNVQGITFWFLGYYIVKYDLRMSKIDRIPLMELLSCYVMFVGLRFYLFTTNNEFTYVSHAIVVPIGMLLVIKISQYIINRKKQVPRIIGLIATYSFFAYASHDFIQTVLKKVTAKIIMQTEVIQVIEYFLVPITTCAITVSVALIISKLFPKIFAVLNGARGVKG